MPLYSRKSRSSRSIRLLKSSSGKARVSRRLSMRGGGRRRRRQGTVKQRSRSGGMPDNADSSKVEKNEHFSNKDIINNDDLYVKSIINEMTESQNSEQASTDEKTRQISRKASTGKKTSQINTTRTKVQKNEQFSYKGKKQ